MAKKNKRKKNRSSLAGGVALGTMAGEIIGNAIGQMLADGLERYLAGPGQKKKTVKMLQRALTGTGTSRRKS
jgi:hypothetical protein